MLVGVIMSMSKAFSCYRQKTNLIIFYSEITNVNSHNRYNHQTFGVGIREEDRIKQIAHFASSEAATRITKSVQWMKVLIRIRNNIFSHGSQYYREWSTSDSVFFFIL